ncbi:outer membrane protein assembly factor BamD [Pyruvatibacter sp. HU-CL02332]|uniref:outer membrane protein assembly factor BamD n=1 Tax=Pyruvatibacter sp. HU-CL02332 TaxID=3127650 RepID=UPI002968E44B|nr:outer membrane protein assembly factor BamD [Alphaproteobacteria bacterium]
MVKRISPSTSSSLGPRTLVRGLALLAALVLAACGGPDSEELAYEERPVNELYNEAIDELEGGNYRAAAPLFDEVERQHPYSIWARRAILMAAFCHYQVNDYDSAVIAAQRFIALHPGNPNVGYAYYLVALSFYEQITDVARDQRVTERALRGLEEVVRRFPDSEYARDSRLKVDLTYDHLAGKEMHIGRWYLQRDQYVAAINRFRTVVTRYQTTTHTAEALHRLSEAYMALGVAHEAQTAAAVLGYNYPGSEWYEYSYALLANDGLQPLEDRASWISRAWNSVF